MPINCVIEDYICSPCAKVERGRIISVALLHVSVPPPSGAVTYGTASYWTALCNTPVSTSDPSPSVVIIPNIRGASDGGAVTEGAGFGLTPSNVIARDFQITWMDPNLENCAFYNSIENQFNYRLAFATESYIFVSEYPASFSHTIPIAENRNSEVLINVTAKLTQGTSICPVERQPLTLLTCCPTP